MQYSVHSITISALYHKSDHQHKCLSLSLLQLQPFAMQKHVGDQTSVPACLKLDRRITHSDSHCIFLLWTPVSMKHSRTLHQNLAPVWYHMKNGTALVTHCCCLLGQYTCCARLAARYLRDSRLQDKLRVYLKKAAYQHTWGCRRVDMPMRLLHGMYGWLSDSYAKCVETGVQHQSPIKAATHQFNNILAVTYPTITSDQKFLLQAVAIIVKGCYVQGRMPM